MPFTEMGVALQQGRVDAAVIPEPGLTVALATGARLFAKPFDTIGSPVSIGAFFSTIDWVRKYPTQTRHFADAIYAAGRWANTHHDESAIILAKYTKMELPTIRAMVRSLSAEQLTPQMLQPMLDAAFRYNLLTRRVTADELIAKPS
jgi:ABC-type nitrate/sulfonate/bicarbonate transport system substrate-binding protein